MANKITKSRWFRAGFILLVTGAAPLLLYVLFEFVTGRKGGNPVGLGLLFFVTFWPAVLLMLVGAVSSLIDSTKA